MEGLLDPTRCGRLSLVVSQWTDISRRRPLRPVQWKYTLKAFVQGLTSEIQLAVLMDPHLRLGCPKIFHVTGQALPRAHLEPCLTALNAINFRNEIAAAGDECSIECQGLFKNKVTFTSCLIVYCGSINAALRVLFGLSVPEIKHFRHSARI